MVLQNDPKLLPVIQKLGCYFLSLGKIIECEADYAFSAEEVNQIWEETKDCRTARDAIIHPDKILRAFSRAAGSSVVVAQIGEELPGRMFYWSWVRNKTADYLVEMRTTSGLIGTHFVLVDKKKVLIYDSYSFKPYKSALSGRYLYYKVLSK